MRRLVVSIAVVGFVMGLVLPLVGYAEEKAAVTEEATKTADDPVTATVKGTGEVVKGAACVTADVATLGQAGAVKKMNEEEKK